MRRPVLQLLLLASPLATIATPTHACPIPVESIWAAIDRAGWFGVLHARCASVPVPEEVRAAWLPPDGEGTIAPPESFIQIVEWKAIRTISGSEEKLPSAAAWGWGCDAEGWQEPSVAAFEADGSSIETPLSMSPSSSESLDARVGWVRNAVKLKRTHAGRLNDRHQLEWVVDGIVDPRTRGVALEELAAAGWWPRDAGEASDSPLGAPEKDRILRGFVREADVPETLPQMLWLLRDQPSLVADLAAIEALESELARLEGESNRASFGDVAWAMTLLLDRLGVAGGRARVRVATSGEVGQDVPALRALWREVRCETGYASRAECEPDPASAQPDPAQP